MPSEEVIEELTGTSPPVGTVEEGKEWIGRTGETHYAPQPVNRSMIQFFASVVEDGNPSYWDERFADQQWGGLVSPAAMMLTWRFQHLWAPDQDDDEEDAVSVATVPLPEGKDNIVNTETETTVHEPITEGTWLNWQTEIVDVTDEKDTMLGPGHFVTSKTYVRDESGELLAEDVNSMLRFDESEAGDLFEADTDEPFAEGRRLVETEGDQQPDDRYESRPVESAAAAQGETVHAFEFPVTYRKVIHDVAATRDFYPVHHDPEFAREQGNETVFLNTMALQGLVDRLALDWAGPAWRVVDRTITMMGSALAGDLLTVEGQVETVTDDGDVELSVSIEKEGRDICPSSVTIRRDG